MKKEQKGFFEDLRDRNVWREVKAYLFGGAALIPLLIALHQFDENIIDVNAIKIVCIIFISLFPSVFLFAYHHGESRDTPWSKTEKTWIPINIIFTVFLVLMFYNNNATAAEFELVEVINPLTQEMEEREIVKSEYRKRLRICYFENHSGDTSLNWMQQGIMEACDIDLDQESYISNNAFWWYTFRKKYTYGENIRFSSYLEKAKQTNTQYLLQGSFNKDNETYSIDCNLIDVKTAKNISKKTFSGDNLFSLIDSISYHVKSTLLPEKHVKENIDLPVSSQLTSSLLAYKYYTLASELYYNEKYEDDDLETKKELYLYNKAIELDPRFAQAYMACIWNYDNTNKPDSVDIYWKKVIENIENYPEKERYSIRYSYLKHTKNYEQAFELLKSWAISYPGETDPHSYLAWHYDREEMYQEAINEYKKCISIDSLNDNYYNYIARIYQNDLFDYEKAIKWKRKYAKISGNKYSSYRSIASFYNNTRELDSVKYYYNKALLIKPAELQINQDLLEIEILYITDYNVVKKKWLTLMQYAKDQRDSLGIMKTIVQFLKYQGQYNKARILSDSIKEIDGSFWDDNKETEKMSLLYDGFNYLAPKGKYKEAIDIINTMSNFVDSIDPTSSLNKEKKSIKKHSESTIGMVGGFYAICLFNLSADFNLPKEYEYIINDFHEELEKMEDHKERWYISFGKEIRNVTKARLLALEGNYTEAIKLLEQHRKGSSDWYLIQLARYYQEIADYRNADEIFEILINKPRPTIYRSHAEINYYAALLYHDWEKQEKAEKHLNISLEIWKGADKDHVYANMAKETAKEWGVEIPSN